jgi:hypothetical protein
LTIETDNTEHAQDAVTLRKSLKALEQDEKAAVSYANLGFAKQSTLALANSTRDISKQTLAIRKLKEQKAAKERHGRTSSASWHPSRMFN